MNSSSTPGKRIAELNKHIDVCQREKAKVIRIHSELKRKYNHDKKRLARELHAAFARRTPEKLVKYYDDCITYYTKHLNTLESNKVNSLTAGTPTKKSKQYSPKQHARKQKSNIIPFLIITAILLLGAGIAALLNGTSITGLSVANDTISAAEMIAETAEDTIPLEIDAVDPESVDSELIQGYAEIGKPVQWLKKLTLEEPSAEITIQLPEEMINLSIVEVNNGTTEIIAASKIKKKEKDDAVSLLENEQTTEYVVKTSAKELEITYATEAPAAEETEFSENKKQVTISSDVHYMNILAHTTIRESSKKSIKIFRTTGGIHEQVSIENYVDSNGDGNIDTVSWVVPSLSTQTYEIILITKAEHLDGSKTFIADIYDEVSVLDTIWSERIEDGEYVRVTFEQPLDSSKDITIYPVNISGTPTINVYENDSSIVLAQFNNLIEGAYNKIYLSNLTHTQDTFELNIVGGSLQFDHIYDPTTQCSGGVCRVVFNSTVTESWSVPAGVTQITGLVIGAGGGGARTTSAGGGGSGGDLRYSSTINVKSEDTLTIWVGQSGVGTAAPAGTGGYSQIVNSTGSVLLLGAGGGGGSVSTPAAQNGTSTTLGGLITGGTGGIGGACTGSATAGGGGGASGYSGNGGDGGDCGGANNGAPGSGGGGGGGGAGGASDLGGAGGGVDIYGEGASGTNGSGDAADGYPGYGGSGGQDGSGRAVAPSLGGKYGGGASGDDNNAEAGNGGQGVVVITYNEPETVAPLVTVTAPANGTNTSVSLTFSAAVLDQTLTGMTVLMQFNDSGTLFNDSAVNSSGTWSVSSLDVDRLAEGLQRMTVFATDSFGNLNATSFVQFTVDKSAPNVRFTAPSPNAVYARTSGNQTFQVTANDTYLTTETIRLSFNNATSTPFNVTTVNLSGVWTASYDVSSLSEGIHTITAIANDSVGNYNRTQTLTFTVDLNGPNATNATPSNDTSFNTGTAIEIGINLTENVLFISNVSFNITYPNNTVSSIFYLGNATQFNRYNVSYIIPLSTGTYNVSFFANDTTGNSIRVLTNFTVIAAATDGAPNVTNITPRVNTIFNASQFIEIGVNITSAGIIQNVTANVSFPNGSTILYYLQNGTNYGTRFNMSLLLDVIGNYNVTFFANDTNNNLNSTEKTNFTVNSAPQIVFVSTVPSQTITEAGTTQVNFSFLVYDENGAEDIVNATAQLRVNLTGETDRTNSSCHPLAVTSTNTVNYTCSINIWYFDNAGNWTVNVSIKDRQSNYTENSTRSFELYSTTAMQMYPTSITWPSLELGTTNRTSNNDPLIINNTGNKDISVGSITVTAYSPQGIFTTTEFIDARNFTISPINSSPGCSGTACIECNGTTLLNQSAQPVISANISAGNLTLNDLFNITNGPQETLFVCIPQVPTSISRQTFATNGTHTAPWIISVS